MKTLLITGAGPTGVTGKLIKERFASLSYCLLTPSSAELDLTDDVAVTDYFNRHRIDAVVHCATFREGISRNTHWVDEVLESNLRMFFNLARHSDQYEKMIYFGSGAEFDKSRDIIRVSEEDFGRSIPKDKYGLGKYIMNYYCRKSDNIYNVRLFGTLNPYERYTKNVVCNLCVKAVMGLPLTLRQDCRFSFVDVNDVCDFILMLLEGCPRYHDYNLVMDETYLLSDIAAIIKEQAHSQSEIMISKSGLNKEYTANNQRVKEEFGLTFRFLEQTVKDIYRYWHDHKNDIDVTDIDRRWK